MRCVRVCTELIDAPIAREQGGKQKGVERAHSPGLRACGLAWLAECSRLTEKQTMKENNLRPNNVNNETWKATEPTPANYT